MRFGRQWDERLRIWDEAFGRVLYTQLGEVALSGFTTMEHLRLEQARARSFAPFPKGTKWGRKWEYAWFRAELTMPPEAAGKRILLHLGAGPEMLVYVNGREAGSIDSRHLAVELTGCAVPGERYEIYAECYAGHGIRAEGAGICGRDEVSVPEPPDTQCVVGSSHFGIHNQELFSVYADYHTLYDLWKALPESDLRAMKIGEALQRFTCAADFEAEEPRRSGSILEAAKLLRPLLARKNGDTVPGYTTFGQSHLDLAWLWPGEETKRKAARTYSNQTALMDRYPDSKFLLCSPTVLEYLKEYYPGLYARVKEKAAAGQFVPEGAVYVESDTNLPGGESLVRQFVLGKRWFRREFGAESRLAWLPDTFGFSGALPQIMKECGVPYFATQKLLRCDPECEQFPYNLFWWEGIDGTRTLSHIYKKNNAVFGPGALRERWEKDRNQKQEIDSFLFPFGYGDGGGGPTELMVETEQRCRDLEGAPKCTMESPAAFFDRLDGDSVKNVYYGELYLAWHRGTYTAQARIKRGVRRAEYALREAEYLAGLVRLAGRWKEDIPPADTAGSGETAGCGREAAVPGADGEEEVLSRLEELWKLLLVQEFHDVLPGTSIERVNREAEEALERVERGSRELAGMLLRRLAGGRALFNSLSWERSFGGLKLPPCGYVKPGDEQVREVGRNLQEDLRFGEVGRNLQENLRFGEVGRNLQEHLQFREGCRSLQEDLRFGEGGRSLQENTASAEADSARKENGDAGMSDFSGGLTFSNDFYSVRLDAQGRITSLRDEHSGYEYAQEPLNQWKLYRDVNVDYDAWELGRMYEQAPEELEGSCSFRAGYLPDGSVAAVVERRERYFTARQRIRFRKDSPRIDFETEVDWQERHRILKVDFPTTVYTKEVLEEIQFGYIRRPTHKSRQYEQDMYETCHHKYAVLTDGENGFAILNNCKYGLSAQDSRLSLTLLRAPVMPDMTADSGQQLFTYSILPFSGPFLHSRVMQEAYELNVDVTVSGIGSSPFRWESGRAAAESVSFFRLEGGHAVLETCKPAFDRKDGVVLRLYEAGGCAGKTILHVPDSVIRIYDCNMLEEARQELKLAEGRAELCFHAFEIKTLLLVISGE